MHTVLCRHRTPSLPRELTAYRSSSTNRERGQAAMDTERSTANVCQGGISHGTTANADKGEQRQPPGTRQGFPSAPNRGEAEGTAFPCQPLSGRGRAAHGAPGAARSARGARPDGVWCCGRSSRRGGPRPSERGEERRRLRGRPAAVRGAAAGGGAGRYLRGRAAAGRDAGPSLGARR